MMLGYRTLSAAVVCGVMVFVSCQKSVPQDQAVAKVWGKTISRDQFEALRRMESMYPTQLHEVFPGSRGDATFLVETQALLKKARAGAAAVTSERDWQWKERYFPAQMYMTEVIDNNLGFTNAQIEKYYAAHVDTFKTTLKVPLSSPPGTAGDSAQAPFKDTVVIRPLVEVRGEIAERMFISKFPPDDAFVKENSNPDAEPVSAQEMAQRWIGSLRRDLPGFFLKKIYEEKFGSPMPEEIDAWYGEGKTITPDDFNVILGWLPEAQRETHLNPDGTKFLATWLLKWLIFSEQAKKSGYSDNPEVANVVKWAQNYEIVRAYIEKTLLPKAREGIVVDTAMVVYAVWDEGTAPGVTPSGEELGTMVKRFADGEAVINLERMIYDVRQKAQVKFLQNDYDDKRDRNPQAMVAEADSLVGVGETDRALTNYRDLTLLFPFTFEGRRAFSDLAKVQTEKGSYAEAIRNYRQYLVSGADSASLKCNTYFMIGFIYDEYLGRSELAELQYKWILKNTPDCELADDAEFMMLHLDEPMTSVEQLRAEARRQGRKIEYDEDEDAVIDTDTALVQ